MDARPIPFSKQEDCSDYLVQHDVEQTCIDEGGLIHYDYNGSGCPVNSYCDYCQKGYNDAQASHGKIVFIISGILGLCAIIFGIMLPEGKNPVNEWVGSGFLLGGLFSIFVGTMR